MIPANPIPRDWFDWTSFVVGWTGLIFTLWAVRQATGARKAAQDSREAVYRRNAADDLVRLSRLASALLASLETGQNDLALHNAREFISICLSVRERHRGSLGADGGRLEVAFDIVGSISHRIQTGRQRMESIADAQRVVADVSGLEGVLRRMIEKEGR